MKVRFAEITAPIPDSVYNRAWWDEQLKSFCSFRHSSRKRGGFPNWNEIRGPGRVEVLHASKIEGIAIFDGIIATTLRCLPRAEVTATGVADV